MKKTKLIIDEMTGNIKDIVEYDFSYDNEQTITLNPARTAAYWWVNRLRKLMRFMAEKLDDPNYANYHVIYRDCLEILGSFDEMAYSELYFRFVEEYRLELNQLALEDARIASGIKEGKHDEINAVINGLLRERYPSGRRKFHDIDLAISSKYDAIIYVSKRGVREYSPETDESKLVMVTPTNPYNYILSGDITRLYFKNLIKTVIIILHEEDKLSEIPLNRLCRDFCIGYISECGYKGDIELLKEEFMKAYKTIISQKELDIVPIPNSKYLNSIACDYKGSPICYDLLDYRENPLDNNGLHRYYKQAKPIADVICARKIDRQNLSKKLGLVKKS